MLPIDLDKKTITGVRPWFSMALSTVCGNSREVSKGKKDRIAVGERFHQ